MALLLALWSVGAGNAAALKKKYGAELTPHQVETSSTTQYTLTIVNKALTQSLGSCDFTLAAQFSFVSIDNVPTGTWSLAGNVLSLRSIAVPANSTRDVAFFHAMAPATPDTYTHAPIVCRQANNFIPQQPSNEFTQDPAAIKMQTSVVSPLPDADIAVTENTESQDPVTASNTVIYTVTVGNNGPSDSGPLTLNDSLPNGGTITSIGGTNWTDCTIGAGGGSASCNHAALDNGVSAEVVSVSVVTPDADTIITNRASVSQSGRNDPVSANNTLDTNTTVNKNTTCQADQLSCGSGTVDPSKPGSVRTCQVPTMSIYICAQATMAATSNTGLYIYSLWALLHPGKYCPIALGSTVLTDCDFEVYFDPVASFLTPGQFTATLVCHSSKCPSGVVNGLVLVYIGQNEDREFMSVCSGPGDTTKCYTTSRPGGPTGNLVITVRNVPPGDPRIAGKCIGSC
jgi:uncharacterized repeat protein (TIGR01451 family)